jgi:hypothetical protein
MNRLIVAPLVACVLFAACGRSPELVAPRSATLLRTVGPVSDAVNPNFNLEVILRPVGGGDGFGHVKFRQANDDITRVDLGVWVRDLAPNTHYMLQRAVDTAVDDNCVSSSWLTLGEGTVPQDIITDDRGTANQDLFRVLPTPVGTPFDIHFRVVTTAGTPVLVSDCYQYYVR